MTFRQARENVAVQLVLEYPDWQVVPYPINPDDVPGDRTTALVLPAELASGATSCAQAYRLDVVVLCSGAEDARWDDVDDYGDELLDLAEANSWTVVSSQAGRWADRFPARTTTLEVYA